MQNNFDDSILIWLNSFMFKWPVFDKAVCYLLYADLLKLAPIAGVICSLWFAPGKEQQRRRAQLTETVLAGLAALVCGRLLALSLPFRERPYIRSELHFALPPGFDDSLHTWSAFPSDHAMLAFALAVGIWRISRPLGTWALLHAALVVCFPRVYFGLHHPTDILAGAAIGGLIVVAVSHLQLVMKLRQWVLRLERSHARAFYAIGFVSLFEMAEMFNGLRSIVGMSLSALKHLTA
jgi:undecaprenyl-diphosphatase